MKTRFVFFDLGNVLLRFSISRMARQGAEVVGCSEDELRQAVFGNDLECRLERGEITELEFYEEFCRAIGKCPDQNRLANAMNDMFEVLEEMQPFVHKLVSVDFPRGILSNTGTGHWNHCVKKYPFLMQCFPTYHVLSFQVGAMKPDRKIYTAAFETAQKAVPDIRPNEILFLDDLERNVAGAVEFGLDAVQFISEQQLADELAKRVLLPPLFNI